jgi:hypothetical protein
MGCSYCPPDRGHRPSFRSVRRAGYDAPAGVFAGHWPARISQQSLGSGQMRRRSVRSGRMFKLDTPVEQLPEGLVIAKRHVRVTISWPSTGLPAADQGVRHHPTEKE